MPCASTSDLLIAHFFSLVIFQEKVGKRLLVCDENPKVTERPANLHKTSKEIRDQTRQLITVPALFHQNKVFKP